MDGGAESPDSPPPEETRESYNDGPSTHSQDAPDSHTPNQDPSATSTRAHTPGELGPSSLERSARYWPSSPRDHEGDRSESLCSLEEVRDDSFTSVLDLIRRSHNLEEPASVAPLWGRTALAQKLGLQTEPSPALHLPSSPLVGTLVDDVNSFFARFVEEQTPNSFIPLPMKRQQRYYRTSNPTFPGPYVVPPGLVSLTLDKTREPKKCPVLIPHALVSSFETALSGVGEVTSWLDWWLSTLAGFSESLPEEARVNFERLQEGYRIPFQDLLPPTRQLPGIVFNVPPRLPASSRPPSRGREHDREGSPGDSTRPGPRLLQPPLPGGKGFWRLETRDRSLSSQRVRTTDPVQDGNRRLSASLCQRGGLPSVSGPEGCVLPDPHPSLLQEVAPRRLRRYGASVQSALLQTVNRPTGLHESLRDGVGLGPHSWDTTPPVPGRLAGPGLLGGRGQATHAGTALVVSLLGIVINEEKSDLEPSQSVEYLGMTIDTVAGRAFPTTARIEKFLLVARRFLSRPYPPAQLWQVLLGHMSSLERLVPRRRLRMRSLQWHLKSHWSSERDPPSLPVPKTRQIEEDLSWWMVKDHLLEGRCFRTPSPDLRLYSDASWSGWGAHFLDRSASGIWTKQESSLHINLREMKALFLALQSFQNVVADHRVTAMCDNSMVVAYVNKQRGTVSDSFCALTGQLLRWTESNNVQLEARYLPGQSNVLADLLSRRNQVLGAEWSLHPQVVRKLIRTWGSPLLDLFATHLNAKLPLYCSLVPDPQAVLEDAFRHPWNDLDTYAFPPFHLVERVVARVRETPNLSMTLVAPLFPEKVWFADHLLLLTQPPLALPLWD